MTALLKPLSRRRHAAETGVHDQLRTASDYASIALLAGLGLLAAIVDRLRPTRAT